VKEPWCIVIPLRLSDAKTRLSTQPAPRRRALVVAMALDVISATQQCPLVGETVLVADQEGLDAAAAAGARAVLDPGLGLNAAIRAGVADATGPVAALLADVPCATPDLIALALSACTGEPAIVSDAEGIGTTLLAARDARSLDPQFGTRSRAAHIAAGAREISDPIPGALAGLRRDVDSEVDLWDARRIGLGAFTRAALDGP
jgi:2-phospho-L-lactate/phosphoenolpyruvate guanylyltransferase